MDDICLKREKHIREDGWLCELVSSRYQDEPFIGIHTYVVSIAPGCTRANHYHRKKEEWIAVTSGKVVLYLEWVHGARRETVLLDAGSCDCSLVHIRPYVAHTVLNLAKIPSSIIVFSKTPEDKEDTIPYSIV